MLPAKYLAQAVVLLKTEPAPNGPEESRTGSRVDIYQHSAPHAATEKLPAVVGHRR